MELYYFFITILCAVCGAYIGLKLKIPAGAIIGSIFSVMLLNIIFDIAYFPVEMKKYIRILAGIYIGSRILAEDVKKLKSVFPASIILVFGLIALNFSLGIIMSLISKLDITTALLASAPGGVQEMTLIADDMDANASIVAFMQMVRIFVAICIMPIILRKVCTSKEYNTACKSTDVIRNNVQNNKSVKNFNQLDKKLLIDILKVLAIGYVSGIFLDYLKVPAGTMVGAMLGIIILNFTYKPIEIPVSMRSFTQTMSGAIIGSGMSASHIKNLTDMAVPVLLLIIILIGTNLFLGYIISRITGMHISTALFSAAPGGVSDMAIIASELGANTSIVSAMQILRLVTVISLFPTIISIFVSIVL